MNAIEAIGFITSMLLGLAGLSLGIRAERRARGSRSQGRSTKGERHENAGGTDVRFENVSN